MTSKEAKTIGLVLFALAVVNTIVFTRQEIDTGHQVLAIFIMTIAWLPVIYGYIKKWDLHWKIFAAMGAAAIAVALFKNLEVPGISLSYLYPVGTIFVNLLKMVIVPLVMTSIIVGVAGIGNPKHLGRMGLKTIVYYMSTSLIAIVIGLGLVNLIKPGVGYQVSADDTAFDPSALQSPDGVLDIIIRMVPTNPVQAAVEGDMLGIIFFSIVFGMALTTVSALNRDKLLPIIDSGFQTMMRLTEYIIALAPIGVFGLIVKAAWEIDPEKIFSLGKYFLTILFALLIHLLIVMPLITRILGGRSFATHFSHMRAAMTTAFSTSSSSATLPVTMECVEKNAGVSNKVSSFVLPMGATINMDGTALYECAGVLFIAQALGFDFSFGTQMVVVFTALLASIGAAGIPSAGLVMIFIVLKAVGLEGPEVNALVGVMLAIDRPLDMLRTVVNITSDSVGALVIARSEGELEEVTP